mgnify:CR=1 FL=1
MQFAISNFSAIENISIEDQTVTVTFTGARSYDYTVNDVTAFTTALTAAMAPEQSVGRFVNKSIKNETLQKVSAWSRLDCARSTRSRILQLDTHN